MLWRIILLWLLSWLAWENNLLVSVVSILDYFSIICVSYRGRSNLSLRIVSFSFALLSVNYLSVRIISLAQKGSTYFSLRVFASSPSENLDMKNIAEGNQCSPVCRLHMQEGFFSISCMLVVAKFSHRNMQSALWVSSRMANWICLFLTACLYHLTIWVISHRRWEESLFLHEQICPLQSRFVNVKRLQSNQLSIISKLRECIQELSYTSLAYMLFLFIAQTIVNLQTWNFIKM